MSLGRLLQARIVLGKKEYLNGFFLQNGSSLQLWWPLVDVGVDGKVYCCMVWDFCKVIKHFVKHV